jgi:23S rRNA (guanosine2251-2'-O)-methyltransferase
VLGAKSSKRYAQCNVPQSNRDRRYPPRRRDEGVEQPALEEHPGRLIAGLQVVREAIRAHGANLLLVEVDDRDAPAILALARFATDRGIRVERVSRSVLDRRTERHQGVVAFAPPLTLHPFVPADLPPGAVVLALDELEDPQNFGAIVRSAVALGAYSVMFPEHHAAPLSPAMFRASAGAIEHVRLSRVRSLPSAMDEAKSAGMFVVGLDSQGEPLPPDLSPERTTLLVVGAEGKGLRRGVKERCDALLSLPMRGPLASLNASVAAALGLSEVLRAR